MANPDHLAILRKGVRTWNEWRNDNREVKPDVNGADLFGTMLSGADLREAVLLEANLIAADLRGTNLREAILTRADLRGTDLREAILTRADLTETDLREANLIAADLREVPAVLTWGHAVEGREAGRRAKGYHQRPMCAGLCGSDSATRRIPAFRR